MIGGEDDVVARLDPIFASISPGGEPSPCSCVVHEQGERWPREPTLTALRRGRFTDLTWVLVESTLSETGQRFSAQPIHRPFVHRDCTN